MNPRARRTQAWINHNPATSCAKTGHRPQESINNTLRNVPGHPNNRQLGDIGMMHYFRAIVLMGAVASIACATPTDSSKKPETVKAETPSASVMTVERAEFYRQAFPKAASFAQRSIPKEMIRSTNKGNNTYIEALNAKQEIVGYLRDFYGPVTIGEECPCAPLQVTLALEKDFTLKTLIAPSPLTKKDHKPLTEAEMAELVAIIIAPDKQIQKLHTVESVIDVTTGATKKELRPYVLKDAGLSTMRLLGLTNDTARILQRAPMARDQERLNQLMSKAANDPSMVATLLAGFKGNSPEAVVFAYRTMVRAYGDALRAGKSTIPEVEERILAPSIDPETNDFELANACYSLVGENTASTLANKCVDALKNSSINEPTQKRISGMAAFWRKDWPAAVRDLALALPQFEMNEDVNLHLRYAQALQNIGSKNAEACGLGKALFRQHPVLPGVKDVLKACAKHAKSADKETDAIITALREERRRALLKTVRKGNKAPDVLSLEGPKAEPIELKLAEKDKITVAVFFATWCPHCRAEFPRMVSFANYIEKSILFKSRVRVLGIRTAVEREKEPYEDFEKRFRPNFPIYTDATMALNFAKFSRSQGLSGGLPTIAIIDGTGDVRFLLDTGDYSDVQRELEWAVGMLLASDK